MRGDNVRITCSTAFRARVKTKILAHGFVKKKGNEDQKKLFGENASFQFFFH